VVPYGITHTGANSNRCCSSATSGISAGSVIYLQVAGHLREQIGKGDLRPGDAVPSVRQLAEQWGISRATAEKALAKIRSEGLIEAISGVGAVVRGAPPAYRRVQDRYATARRTGRIYIQGEYACLRSAELTDAPDDVAEALGVDPWVCRRPAAPGDDAG
jgi:GntR family transcriptional regulator